MTDIKIQKYSLEGLDCQCAINPAAHNICYLLYPLDALGTWLGPAASKYGVSIVQITGMDWQNVFSPWPHSGIPAGTPDFKGESPQFLKSLIDKVIPDLESRIGIAANLERDLAGVSMSGLFTLWQWMQNDFFKSIISLSGSFWYPGFLQWFESRAVPHKTGKAFFLLGRKEPHSPTPEFNSVGSDTETIITLLRQAGVDTVFEWVPGNHFTDPTGRLDLAFNNMYL